MKRFIETACDVLAIIAPTIAWLAAVLVGGVFILLFYAAAITAIVGPIAFIAWLFGRAIGVW